MDDKFLMDEADHNEQDFDLQVTFIGNSKEVLKQMENCAICGSRLILKYFADYTNLTTLEKAKCSECGVRTRSAFYSLN